MKLSNIKLGYSPLSDSIYLYRHGKDERVALEKRNAESDVMKVLVEHMMYEAPRGAKKQIQIGSQKYEVTVKPISEA